MKFKIRDKVKIRKDSRWYKEDGQDKFNPINEIGVIDYIKNPPSNDYYIGVQWNNNIHNNYSDEDLELYEEKSNKVLAKEYLYDTITNDDNCIITTLENRDKFYKILDLLSIKYYKYSKTTLSSYKKLYAINNEEEGLYQVNETDYKRGELDGYKKGSTDMRDVIIELIDKTPTKDETKDNTN